VERDIERVRLEYQNFNIDLDQDLLD